MGGVNFDCYSPITDPQEAFSALKQDAAWEHGHGGYTGTIAEKPGFVIRNATPMSKKAAQEFIYGVRESAAPYSKVTRGDYEDNNKWGDAYAVPISAEDGGGWMFYGWASS